MNLVSARVNELTDFIPSIICGASSLSTASAGGHVRPVKQVGVVRDVWGRSGESNDIILFPNKVISSHDGLVSSPMPALKKIQPRSLIFFGHPLASGGDFLLHLILYIGGILGSSPNSQAKAG